MGAKRLRREAFFRKHPVCCFCGGERIAIEEDHLPPRVAFRDRQWPEGFNFPACYECNHASAGSEQVFALMLRLGDVGRDADEMADLESLVQAVRNNAPDCLPSTFLPANEKRRVLRNWGLQLARGETFAEAPVIRVPTQVEGHITAVTRKLVRALHYKEVGMILPRRWGLLTAWAQQVTSSARKARENLQEAMPSLVIGQRTNTNLGDQFRYVWGQNEVDKLFGFQAFFGQGLMLLGASASPEAIAASGSTSEWNIEA